MVVAVKISKLALMVANALIALVLAAVVVAVVVNVLMLLGQGPKISETDQLASTADTYDCILVLGAAVRPDGSPSAMLAERLDTGIELYNKGVAPKIVMSGDDMSDSSYDEVTNMKAYAVAHGVPSEDVFCDHAGLCTYDSAYRAKYVFEANSAVVVSQKYHLYRALYDFESFGIKAVGVPADRVSYAVKAWYNIREAAARVSDFIKVITKQNAAYLSEPVSLDQSGDVTTW